MTPEIIARLFPNPLPSVAEIEAKYPPRRLPEGAKATRIAPSPTGLFHIGNLYAALVAERAAHQSGGIFYIRVEDTDQKRAVDGALKVVCDALAHYGMRADEGVDADGKDYGPYAPYTQSQRRDIYQAYVKSLVEKGLAYPCFCSAEDLDMMRKVQEKNAQRPGYYGKYAKCRGLTDAEILAKLDAGAQPIIRFKSSGDPDRRMVVKDLFKGELNLPENDIDQVILKSDGLPSYHFAHVVDDHLMGTTHVTRADEWLSSVTTHIQMFVAMGWKPPKYGHIAPLQKLDNGNRRKLSKRHDPEANIMYFAERGYPRDAVVEYLLNLINAQFEDWRKANPDTPAFDFPLNMGKMSNVAGALFDFVKLNSISREIVARLTAGQVYDETLAWARQYAPDFARRMADNRRYLIDILDIERHIGAKSRKDLAKWEDVPPEVSYFFDDLFTMTHNEKMTMLAPMDEADVMAVARDFAAAYDPADDKDAWFDKVRRIAGAHGFAADMKAYKASPAAFKGSVADAAKILRVLVTGSDKSPDLHAVMRVLGREAVVRRLNG
ncbi:MAG: glutamate--tRNA ligase family protein [Alphaproteobacteria bacterium]|nr:glutamate--tRNA ligase family protein [Alphaproteobacteria bacterium]